MYNILIIDDEEIIADGIKFLVEDHFDNLNIFCFYDSNDAIECAKKTRIDILLTDIKMPGINGLELHKRIINLWGHVKTVFLSGYTDFDYVKSAIRQKSCDYVLKTEDDRVLLSAIDTAIKMLTDEEENSELIALSKKYINKEKPILKQRFFNRIIEKGEEYDENDIKLLDISIDMQRDIIIIASKMRAINSENKFLDNVLACTSLVQEKLKERFYIEEYMSLEDEVIWLVQSIDERTAFINNLSYLSGILDIVSKICKEQLNVDSVFLINSEASNIDNVPDDIEVLRNILYKAQTKDSFGVMTSDHANDFFNINKTSDYELHRKLTMDIANIIKYIDNDDAMNAKKQLTQFIETIAYIHAYPLAQEHYASLKFQILKSINRNNVFDAFVNDAQTNCMIHSFIKSDGRLSIHTYTTIIDKMIEYKKDTQVDQYKKVVSFLDVYIGEHLCEDLSLTKLSEITHFNPSYLSRIYKQETGTLLSDNIHRQKIAKAKELLSSTYEKISHIGCEIGINNPAHFTRYFKKHTGMTPNEYRNKR